MNIRIKFAKYGNLKYLSHLDVMRFFQKAVRRADIDVTYSTGFHPHQIMSFAAPLGVGQTSEGEYFDMELNSVCDVHEIERLLDAEMPEGFKVLNVSKLPDHEQNKRKESVMALVKTSSYLVLKKDGYDCPFTNEELKNKFKEFVKLPEIIATKVGKGGENEINLAPCILDIDVDGKTTEYSGQFENGLVFYVLLTAGNENHVRPELLMKSFYQWMGLELNPYEYHVHRLESFTEKDGERIAILDYHKELNEE